MARRRAVRHGQPLIEYTILVVCAAGALLWMFQYLRSASMHHMKTGADGLSQGLLQPEGPDAH